MSAPLVLGALWVIAGALTAMLPPSRQTIPGAALMILAPVLLALIAYTHGLLWFAFGVFAFCSMFREPLYQTARRLFGLGPLDARADPGKDVGQGPGAPCGPDTGHPAPRSAP